MYLNELNVYNFINPFLNHGIKPTLGTVSRRVRSTISLQDQTTIHCSQFLQYLYLVSFPSMVDSGHYISAHTLWMLMVIYKQCSFDLKSLLFSLMKHHKKIILIRITGCFHKECLSMNVVNPRSFHTHSYSMCIFVEWKPCFLFYISLQLGTV